MFDLIGDIHGNADKLIELLTKLGYKFNNGCYRHPERKAVFVGDYIDRGPKIKETLEIVRRMVDNDQAVALMGNHEYNALCFHFQESEGGHLRKHLIKNIIQHYETLKQFQNQQQEYENYLDWFMTLPLFFETNEFRAVHACWDQRHINYLKQTLIENRLTDDLIYRSVNIDSDLNKAIEVTVKGKEINLPDGQFFHDKDGAQRSEIRIRWWEPPIKATYKTISIEPLPELPDTPVMSPDSTYYEETEKPIFFGHYWLKGQPNLYRNNICCLDYSVARQGFLVAYRFDGEKVLEKGKLIWV